MSQNLIEKITQNFTTNKNEKVYSGDYVQVQPHYIMTHDNTGAIIPKFKNMGFTKIAQKDQVVCALDHNIQDKSIGNKQKYQNIEKFCDLHNIDFYRAGTGIGHQIMCEEGYAWPNTFVVASDSHTNMYGGLGCLGTPVVRTDAAVIWGTGHTWWQIPPVAKVEFIGKLLPGVTGKDVIIALCGYFNQDEVLNYAIEFCGEGISELAIHDRMTIANMTTEWGALVGLFPIDSNTISWLCKRADFLQKKLNGKLHSRISPERINELLKKPLTSDSKAIYHKYLQIDLSTITPHVSGPNSVKVMTSVADLEKRNIQINKAYLVSCVNSRVEDLAQAAHLLQKQKIHSDVKFYVSAASEEVQQESIRCGDWQVFLDAGAYILPPGCGPCIGLGEGILEENEVAISATNRNFKGRMGAKSANVYLSSPAVVAASAVAGKIVSPQKIKARPVIQAFSETITTTNIVENREFIDRFPKKYQGKSVLCLQNNINTDGIYPGKYTYIDHFSPQQQAEVAMENYDVRFTKIARRGDILICGFNFGTGSSREQAATALKYFGIQMLIAGSFSQTFKRNAINNGFLVVEAPQLVRDLQEKHTETTIRLETNVEIDFAKSSIVVNNKKYLLEYLPKIIQELIVDDGIQNWICR
ncbi:homoaconitase [Candidatus Uabimicrobium sp. HlEnr_7]|uniref:homoaconitase n=1 Tax=Candidatus Uabimicrobium helgolandensis TaxID=3095367 RepID=UPI003558F9AC